MSGTIFCMSCRKSGVQGGKTPTGRPVCCKCAAKFAKVSAAMKFKTSSGETQLTQEAVYAGLRNHAEKVRVKTAKERDYYRDGAARRKLFGGES